MAYYTKNINMGYEMKNIVHGHNTIEDIPDAWIYKYYYKRATQITINQPFDGRSIRVKSVVNRDSNPSLFFFCKEGRYYWKDFSSGDGGDALGFASRILSKFRNVAVVNVIADYERFLMNGTDDFPTEDYVINPQSKTKIHSKVGGFKIKHIEFFKKFKITMPTVMRFNVWANENYTIEKNGKTMHFVDHLSFSFKGGKETYQIYLPDRDPKYLNLNTNYLIGSEQLKKRSKTCAIVSGLKDIMAITELDLDCEYVAWYSESVLMPSDKIKFLKESYENVITILDNDPTGIRMMRTYQNVYGIRPVHIKLEKDLSENNEKHDMRDLRNKYAFMINKAINE